MPGNDRVLAALVELYRGKAEYRLARMDDAEASWNKALRLNPTVPEAGWCLLELYYLQGRPDDARRLALRLHEVEPDPRDRVQFLLELLVASKVLPDGRLSGRIVQHFRPSGGNALGIYQGSASGMKMSKGQMGRQLLGLAVAGMALVAGGTASAELGQPAPWEWTLQESATPVMDYIIWFHNWLVGTITVITLFVLVLLIMVVVKFNAKANPIPSKTTHNTLIEVAWTLIPVLILVGDRGAVVPAAVPAARHAEGRPHHQGDRQAVVLELRVSRSTASSNSIR